MKTIKLPYTTSNYDLIPLLKQYSSCVRFAYNRFRDKAISTGKLYNRDGEVREAVK